MISDVGRALRTLLRPHVPAGAAIHLGPPPGDAAGPAVHIALCWLRADPNGQQSGDRDVRAADGTVLGRQAPARRYELRYLVTASADSAEAEYELLDAVLLAVTGLDALPGDCLSKNLADAGMPVFLKVCTDPMAGPSPGPSGVPAHAGFELTVNAPLLPPMQTELAPPAAELAIGVRRPMPQRHAPPAPPGSDRRWRRARVSEEGPTGGAADAGGTALAGADRARAPRTRLD